LPKFSLQLFELFKSNGVILGGFFMPINIKNMEMP